MTLTINILLKRRPYVSKKDRRRANLVNFCTYAFNINYIVLCEIILIFFYQPLKIYKKLWIDSEKGDIIYFAKNGRKIEVTGVECYLFIL